MVSIKLDCRTVDMIWGIQTYLEHQYGRWYLNESMYNFIFLIAVWVNKATGSAEAQSWDVTTMRMCRTGKRKSIRAEKNM